LEINKKEASILKKMFEHFEQNKNMDLKFKIKDENVFKRLQKLNLIEHQQDKVSLTELGFEESKKIIRKHRLAEKLFHDSLGLTGNEMEIAANKLEKIMKGNVEECICSFLSHPKTCPHGKDIPSCSCNGNSCHCSVEIKEILEKSVLPLTQLKEGQSGIIIYVHSPEVKNLHKLIPIEISPGKEITVIRTSTSPLFKMDDTKITLNRKIAEKIMVRI